MADRLMFTVCGDPDVILCGDTAEEIVARLHELHGDGEHTQTEWMESAANNVCGAKGVPVSTKTPTKFLEGLEKAGLLQKIAVN